MVSTRFQNIVITIALGLFVFGGSAVGAPTGESALARRESQVASDLLEPVGELTDAGDEALVDLPDFVIRDESEMDDDSRRPKKKKHHRPVRRPKPKTAITKKPTPKKSLLDPVTGLAGNLPVVGGVVNKVKGLLGNVPLVGGLL